VTKVKIALIGHGGHSKVICEILLSSPCNEITGWFDDKFECENRTQGIHYGPIGAIPSFIDAQPNVKFIIAIGNNYNRKAISERLGLGLDHYTTAIHPSAIISPSAIIGSGTVVMPYAVINAHSEIGEHAIINTCSVIEHDNKIEAYSHISPNATLTGNVHIEEGAHIGASATVIPQKRVGAWSKVGAGATVIHDIPDNCTAVGTPARIKIKDSIGGGNV
jgi:acetyltransferase EpsM